MYSDTKWEIFHETGQTVDMTIKQAHVLALSIALTSIKFIY